MGRLSLQAGHLVKDKYSMLWGKYGATLLFCPVNP